MHQQWAQIWCMIYQGLHMQTCLCKHTYASLPLQSCRSEHTSPCRYTACRHMYADIPMQHAQISTKRHAQMHARLHAGRASSAVLYDCICIPAWLQENQELEKAAAAKSWLMSEQTLDKRVVQRLDFTKNLKEQRHLFLEVRILPLLFLRARAGWKAVCVHMFCDMSAP